MTNPGFRHLIQSDNFAPRWLRNSVLGRYLWSIGLTLDVGTQWLHEGIAQRLPQQCVVSALSWLGRDRRIRRGFGESIPSYRERLIRWRSAWRLAGGAWSILEQFQAYFLPAVPVVRLVSGGTSVAQWWTRGIDGSQTFHRSTPSNWDWDSQEPGQTPLDTQRRYWLMAYQDPVESMFPASGTTAPSSSTITQGTGGLVTQARDLLFLATERKQEGTWCAGIIICYDDSLFLPSGSGAGYPDGTWYRYSDPVTRLPVRPRDARYFADRRRPGLFETGLTSEVP